MAGGIRASEINVKAKLESAGDFNRAIAEIRALKAESAGAGPEVERLGRVGSLTKAEFERLVPTLKYVGAEMKNARAATEEMRAKLEQAGVHGKLLSNTLQTLGRDTAATGRIWGDFNRLLMSFGVDAGTAAKQADNLVGSMFDAEAQAKKSVTTWTQLQSLFKMIGGAGGMGILIGAIVALAAALGPVVVMMGAWLIVTAAFTVGLTAMVAVLGLAFGAVAALGAGIAFLADMAYTNATKAATELTKAEAQVAAAQIAHANAVRSLQNAEATLHAARKPTVQELNAVAQAQQNVQVTALRLTTANNNLAAAQAQVALTGSAMIDPLGAIEEHLKSVVAVLGMQAAPLLIEMALAADEAVGPLQKLGANLITWFGGRLPLIMEIAAGAANDLGSGIKQLGDIFGPFIDKVMIRALGVMRPVFDMFGQLAVSSVQGLLENLLKLSDWFTDNFPKMAPIVGEGFSKLGSFVQGFGKVMNDVVQWIIRHWDDLKDASDKTIKAWGEFFSGVGSGLEVWRSVAEAVGSIVGPLKDMIKGGQDGEPIFKKLGQTIGFLAPIITTVVIITGIWLVMMTLGAIKTGLWNMLLDIWRLRLIAVRAATIAATIATAIFNAVMDANPISLIVLGLIALGLILIWVVTHWSTVVSWLRIAWDWIQQVGEKHAWLQLVLAAIFGPIILLVWHWKQVINIVQDVINWFGHTGDAMWQLGRVAEGVVNWIGDKFSGLGGNIHNALWWVAHTIDNFDRMVDNIPVLGGILHLPTDLENFARGGIVTRPTLGVFGEAGPEALIPVGAGAGPRAVELWKQAGQMLGMGAGSNVDMTPGDWGGQCLQFVTRVTGAFAGVPMAAALEPYVNSGSPSPGEVFVSTVGTFGHTGFVIGGGKVLDSNWNLDEIIHVHNLGDIPDIVGYISGVPGLTFRGSGGLFGWRDAMKALVGRALGGLGGWEGQFAGGLMDKIIDGSMARFDHGGIWPSGTLGANLSGKPEYVFTQAQMGAGGGPITIEVPVVLNGHEIARAIRHDIGPELHREFQARTGWRGRG